MMHLLAAQKVMVKFGNKCVLPECRSDFFLIGPEQIIVLADSTHILLFFVNSAMDDSVYNIHLC